MRPIRIALFGGGPGSFIGAVHRQAALMDGRFELVAGVFSRDPGKSHEQGQAWGLSEDRVHSDVFDLLSAELARADPIEAVAIATPNATHFSIAVAALRAGLHVICDKPMTATLEEARKLSRIARDTDRVFALTYTYAGYPLIREARARIKTGTIGAVRKVQVDYPQGWLAFPVRPDNRQAVWRLDPQQAGIGGCIGDIGVHAFHLAEYVSGLRVSELCADLNAVVPGRVLDDDCNVLLRFANGASGVLTASQVATGERNGLSLRIHGESGTLAWSHEAAGELRLLGSDGTMQTIYAGTEAMGPAARRATRLPSGHPEGFLEAFANLYQDFADAIAGGEASDLPEVGAGLRSLLFVDTAVRSSHGRCWKALEDA